MVVGISKGQHRARTRLSPNALARCGLSDYQADDRSRGEVAEWSNVAVSKTVEPRGSQGSNPCLPAINSA